MSLTLCLCAAPVGVAPGQSGYYNLDAGRPTRVEDAVPTARNELEIQLPTLRVDRFDEGTIRWRVEPKLAFGILPFTEVELRVPVVRMLPRAPSPTSTGIASLGLGVLHALNLETQGLPAFALAGEISLPVGSLASPRGSYAFKALASKTFAVARLQLNVGGGSWNVRLPSAPNVPVPTCGTGEPGVSPCELPPVPPDVPCLVVPTASQPVGRALDALRARCFGAPVVGSASTSSTIGNASTTRAGAAFTPRSSGMRWMAGIGIDHAFPLQSTLIVADFVIERFYGLYALSDWTAEVGVRKQLTPQLVADVGIGRRFHGATPSTSVAFGFTYGVATSLLSTRGGGRK